MTDATNGYERRIGRYGRELAHELIAVAHVRPGQRALDVGCGTGALTEPLARLLGAEQVVAIDPDPDAVAACRGRLPGVDVRLASAEALPLTRPAPARSRHRRRSTASWPRPGFATSRQTRQ